MSKELYNTAHPMEAGKSIFLPFGEWDYDGRCRQRLDHQHGEAIANELNARVERGEPGIPVYQGHPDVPQLAARYPDKGALGWVTKIELANEGGKDGLRLSVDWDRDPGKGFRWFSPYWIANGRDGATHIVSEIASIGLVNNPNIREFRLANESASSASDVRPTFQLPAHLVALAKKFDERRAMANVVDANGAGHGADGRFDGSGSGGGGAGSGGSDGKGWAPDSQLQAKDKLKHMLKSAAVSIDKGGHPTKDDVVFEYNRKMYYVGKDNEHMVKDFADRGLVKRVRGYHITYGPYDPKKGYRAPIKDSDMIAHPALKKQEAKAKIGSLWKELAAKYDKLEAARNR